MHNFFTADPKNPFLHKRSKFITHCSYNKNLEWLAKPTETTLAGMPNRQNKYKTPLSQIYLSGRRQPMIIPHAINGDGSAVYCARLECNSLLGWRCACIVYYLSQHFRLFSFHLILIKKEYFVFDHFIFYGSHDEDCRFCYQRLFSNLNFQLSDILPKSFLIVNA